MTKFLGHPYKATVCIDFDGTIYSYSSGWRGQTVLRDNPCPGARKAIAKLREKYCIIVFSVRANEPDGEEAIRKWLQKENIIVDGIIGNKPNAYVFIDDRNIPFNNNWEEMVENVENFQNWREKDLPIIKSSDDEDKDDWLDEATEILDN